MAHGTIKKFFILNLLLHGICIGGVISTIDADLFRHKKMASTLRAQQAEDDGLENDVACLNTVVNLVEPLAPPQDLDPSQLYPIELATKPISFSRVVGLSRNSRKLNQFRTNNLEELGGTWFRNITGESAIAINPTDPNNMIIATQQDHWGVASWLTCSVFYTLDGGKTWSQSDITTSRHQDATTPDGVNDWEIANDPEITFDQEGNAYFSYLGFNFVQAVYSSCPGGNFNENVGLFRSTDKGQSWNKVQNITIDDGNEHFIEKQTIIADPYRKNVVYAFVPDILGFVGVADKAVIRFFKSNDLGVTWIDQGVIYDSSTFPPSTDITFLFQPAVQILDDKDHTIVVGLKQTEADADPTGPAKIIVLRSPNGGNSWTSQLVQEVTQSNFLADPGDPSQGFLSFGLGVNMALSPKGTLYMTYQSARAGLPSNQCAAYIIKSDDGGLSWSIPKEVRAPSSYKYSTIYPFVAVACDGVVGVLFYDFRNYNGAPPPASLSTDIWIQTFNSSLTKRLKEVRVTPVSFDLRQAMQWTTTGDSFLSVASEYVRIKSIGRDFVGCINVTNPPYGIGTTAKPVEEPGGFVLDDRHRQETLFVKYSRPCKKEHKHKKHRHD